MATQIAPLPIRILGNLADKFTFIDDNTQGIPSFVRGDDIVIELGIGEGGVLLTPPLTGAGAGGIANVTCQIFAGESDTNPPVMSAVVLSNAMTLDLAVVDWTNNNGSHARFVFSNAVTAIDLGSAANKSFWLRIFITTSDAPAKIITLCEGSINVKDGPISTVAAPPAALFRLFTVNGNVTPQLYDPVSGKYYNLELSNNNGLLQIGVGDVGY